MCFTNFLVLLHVTLTQKVIHILNTLHSVHVTINITNMISYLSYSDHAAKELKLGTIGKDLKHLPMPMQIPIFMAPPAPPPANPSNLQPVELQTSDKYMTSFPKTEKGYSLKLPYTTPADFFAQASKHLKISSNHSISNKSSIP